VKRHVRQRWWVLVAALALAVALAAMLEPGNPKLPAVESPSIADAPHSVRSRAPPRVLEQLPLEEAFTQALVHLGNGREKQAITEFEVLIRRAASIPEFHVNLGFALLAERRLAEAREAFVRAIDLRPSQANAYYGLAVVADGLGDSRAAIGAMRTFVHLAPAQQPHIPRARAAIWEWQASLDAVASTMPGSANPVHEP